MKLETIVALCGTAGLLIVAPVVAAQAQVSTDSASSPQRRQAETEAKTQIDDSWITTKVKSQFAGVDELEGSVIDVETSRGVVTLRGTVPNQVARAMAVALARRAGDVRGVVDRLEVDASAGRKASTEGNVSDLHSCEGPSVGASSPEVDRTFADAWITTRLRARFVPEDVLDGSDIDVATANGIVRLSGTVPSEAGRVRALEIARATGGVRQVVDEMLVGNADGGQADPTRATTSRAEDKARQAAEMAADAGERDPSAADTWIAAKVKSQFIGIEALKGSAIDVETTGGVVTLTGHVATADAKARAAEIAQAIDGVTSVHNRLAVRPR